MLMNLRMVNSRSLSLATCEEKLIQREYQYRYRPRQLVGECENGVHYFWRLLRCESAILLWAGASA